MLRDRLQAPIIVTFHMPRHAKFVFQSFYDKLKERGYVIYPGKLTVADSFRIGCIGRLNAEHMRGALDRHRRGAGRAGRYRLGAGERRGKPMTGPANPERQVTLQRPHLCACRQAPTVVVCLDGSEPGYIEATIAAGRAPTFARFMARRCQPAGAKRHPELHQPQQSFHHHGPAARRARHRRQFLL